MQKVEEMQMKEVRTHRPGHIARALAVTMFVLIGLTNGIGQQVAKPSTTIVEASESPFAERSRAGSRGKPDRWARVMHGGYGGPSVSSVPGSSESVAQVSTPRANGRIAFARSLNISEVQVVNADGSNQKGLTNSQGFDGEPVWSPDGSRIAFGSGRHGNAEIYVMNSDGSNPTRLTTDPAEDYAPVWSPDGSRIAFSRHHSWSEIYVMNLDSGNQTRLTNNIGHSYDPAWSPDGSKIAFTNEVYDGSYIMVMSPDGSGQTNINSSSGNDYDPVWSPDGAKIAYARFENGNQEIYVMNADGSGQINLTNSVAFDASPSWSPDGTRIVFDQIHNPNTSIYVMNSDGSNQTRLNNDSPGFSGGAVWSPDGSRIAFMSNRGGSGLDIYVMNVDGSNQARLTHNLDAYNLDPDWEALPPSATNAIDDAQFFVRQHYRDFLNREPDEAGLAHWVGEINSCNDPSRRLPGESLAGCFERKRTNTSAAFFLSPEFQYTGYFVYRLFTKVR